MSPDKIPINWFDLALVVVLLLGIWRGRKLGMSGQLLPLLTWVGIFFGAGLGYEPLAEMLLRNTPLGQLACRVLAYLAVVLGGLILFSLIRYRLGGKLIGSDAFGSLEYYLGMAAGMLQFAAILLVLLALLNARLYNVAEVRAMQRFQQENYGSNFFPTLQSVQQVVFVESFTGPHLKRFAERFFIRPTPPGGGKLKRIEKELPGV